MQPPTQETLDKYQWYYQYTFPNGAETRYFNAKDIWDFIQSNLKSDYFAGKSVLDCGCRDCQWSFQAEKLGAASIVAVDHILNAGVNDVLIPYFNSKVRMFPANVMNLDRFMPGESFDTILYFGLLYHLRYPMLALRKVSQKLKDGGLLLLETAILTKPEVEEMPMLWCPVQNSPYEVTSCTFFNIAGLKETLESFGMEMLQGARMNRDPRNHPVPYMDRAFFVFRKKSGMTNYLEKYWEGENVPEEIFLSAPEKSR